MTRSRSVVFATAAVLSLGALEPVPASAASGRIEDDYPRALAAAKERGVPILVDVWAPW
jgi:hypothetical protein